MARMDGVPFIGIADNGTMSAWDIVCVHTIVGYQANGNAAHFTTGASGRIVQARDTRYRSAANLNGNYRVIAIENEDFGPAYGSWSGSNVPRFTPEQAEAIAKIIVWCHQVHGIPIELVQDSKPGRRGVAYHRQGIDGNFTTYAGRVAGGELWSSSTGKVCPGDRRISQLITEIIPRARVLAGQGTAGSEEDMTPEQAQWLAEIYRSQSQPTLKRGVDVGDVLVELHDMAKAFPALVAAVADGDLAPEAVLARVDTAVREATTAAVNNVVLPALRAVLTEALGEDNQEQAEAIVVELGKKLQPAA